jgi:peptidoglycan/LPS O-acetylase OafA/YrhL
MTAGAAYLIAASGLAAVIAATITGWIIARLGFPLLGQRHRIGWIDGLRGYLALAVMLFHHAKWLAVSRMDAPWYHPLAFFPDIGAVAVALFFMVSGLVFYPRVVSGFHATNWRALYLGRVFRLMPAIAVSIILVLLVISSTVGALPSAADAFPLLVWLSALQSPALIGFDRSWMVNAGVLWTLRVEWLFYLLMLPVAAALMGALRSRGLSRATVLALGAAASIGFMLLAETAAGSHIAFYASMPLLFIAGMAAGEFVRAAEISTRLQGRVGGALALAALVLGTTLWEPWGSVSLASFVCLTIFFAAIATGNSLFGLLSSRGARVLGECSFGIYLLHGVALFAFFESASSWTGQLAFAWSAGAIALVTPFVVGVAAILHLAVERPAIALGKSLASKWRTDEGNRAAIEQIAAP